MIVGVGHPCTMDTFLFVYVVPTKIFLLTTISFLSVATYSLTLILTRKAIVRNQRKSCYIFYGESFPAKISIALSQN